MQLVKMRVKNFRRLAEDQSLDLNENLIALVGPNEAGKSSLLDAIMALGDSTRPSETDTTRGCEDPAQISWLFVIEPEDRNLLAGIHQGEDVRHVWIEAATGQRQWRIEPRPDRDLAPRHSCLELLSGLEDDSALEAELDPQLLLDAKSALVSDSETLAGSEIDSLQAVVNTLSALSNRPPSGEDEESHEPSPEQVATRKVRDSAISVLAEIVSLERQPLPVDQVIDALTDRIPQVAYFDVGARDLRSDYNLAEVLADLPPALQNLCETVDLDLAEVNRHLESNRIPHVESLFEEANSKLKDRFQATWRQSRVYPRLGTPLDGILRIFIATEGGNYSFPEERSDGLRWFLALHAFLTARGKLEPIVLVDEAETHLHYDAQADLVDALMTQRLASKVVYTTHSVGCLPPDLGCGLRAVLIEEGGELSRIANSYWSQPESDDKVGYTPLLFAMGARLLSLTIPRYGVVTEGPADAILLPTLLRCVSGSAHLPYRVVPGLAELAASGVKSLLRQAGSVALLVDGDHAGLAMKSQLQRAGVDVHQILNLGSIKENCTLEDLLTPSALAAAVNHELDNWGIGPFRVDPSKLPATMRWKWLLEQGEATGTAIDRLSKPRVAQRVVDHQRDAEPLPELHELIDESCEDGLRDLEKRIRTALDV